MTIHFTAGACSIGSVLIACSQKGICAILIGDSEVKLAKDLQSRFSDSDIIQSDDELAYLLAKVLPFIEQPSIGLDAPLDIRGTAFQQSVWQALCEIPPGMTASYMEIAQKLGAPKAFRAVAQACGSNALAVAIPCHRVVKSDGGLSGYRWGIERKRLLLQRESMQSARVS